LFSGPCIWKADGIPILEEGFFLDLRETFLWFSLLQELSSFLGGLDFSRILQGIDRYAAILLDSLFCKFTVEAVFSWFPRDLF